MKYILLMSGTKAGVDTYHAWSQKDIEAHMAVLQRINKDLTDSGEFVATQGLAEPMKRRLCAARKTACRSQTVFFPSRRSFCWATGSLTLPLAERAYAIAGRISAAPGPGGQIHEHADRSAAVRNP